MKLIVLAALRWWPLVGWSCLAASEPVPPVRHVGEPVALSPGWAEFNQGQKSLAEFDLPRAAQSFVAACERAPRNVDYAVAHALTLLLQQRFADGRAAIERAVTAGPPTRNVQMIRAFAAALARDRAGALRISRPQTDLEWLVYRLSEDLTSPRQPIAMETATRQFPKIAAEFAKTQMKDSGDDKALLARGLQHRANQEYAAAVADLAEYVAGHPDDGTARFYYGATLTGAGNYDRARHELSVVLCGQPALFEGYAQRAIAAARMGNLSRAQQDLALARQLDAKDRQWLSVVEKVIAETEAVMPSEPAPRWFDALLAAARKGQSLEQLAPLAIKLVRSAHAKRLDGDEVYQDKLRRLQWAVVAEPKSGAKLAAVGRFLFDEIDVRGEYVDPGKHFVHYRTQTRHMQDAELKAARDFFQRGLGADSSNVAALVGLAEIKYRENLFGDAENLVRSALGLKQEDPNILGMMSRLMKVAAGQQLARAMNAASTHSWVESMGNGWERRYVQYGDPVAAAAFGRSADGMLDQANAYTRRALEALKDTPESYDYLGTLAMTRNNHELMLQSYQRAVQKAPHTVEYRYALANAYAKLGNFDGYFEHAQAGRNLEQTSIGAYLLTAWQAINAADWKRASDFLIKASRVDPGDSRILAYLGAVAEGQNQVDEAAACFRAALALEEANGTHRAASLGAGSPVCLFEETARAVALRIRLARMIEEQHPQSALALYEKNLEAEARLKSPEMISLFSHVEGRNRSETEQRQLQNHPMLRVAIEAMLPEPKRTSQEQSAPPNAAGLLQTSRSLAAVALYQLGRKQEAAAYFRQSDGYSSYARRHGVGSAYLSVVGIWTPRPVAQIAQACYREIGEPGVPRRGPPGVERRE